MGRCNSLPFFLINKNTMFYDRKAIQRRIILEKFKDEDIDPSLYSGKFGDDVEAAENDYYNNYSIHWPDYSEQPKWTREQADDLDEKGEGGYGKGGKYGAAKRIQEQMVEKYGENWKEVAEQEIKTYYGKRKEKIEAELAREGEDEAYMKEKYPKKYQQMMDDIEGDKGRAFIYKKSTLGNNDYLERELADCEEYIKNARHYILTQVGLRAINAIEVGLGRNKWGEARVKHESEEHEKFVFRMAAFYVWSPFLKAIAETGIKPRAILAKVRQAKTPDQILALFPQQLHGINFTQLRQLFGQWFNYFKTYGYGLLKGNAMKQQVVDFVDMARMLDYPLWVIGRKTRHADGTYDNNDYVKQLKEKLSGIFDEAMGKAETKWKEKNPDVEGGQVYNPFGGFRQISSQIGK